jgi:hypothetical protein
MNLGVSSLDYIDFITQNLNIFIINTRKIINLKKNFKYFLTLDLKHLLNHLPRA